MPKPIESEAKLGLTSIQKSLFEAEVTEQLRTVYDPEIPVNVYDLGLIYDIQVDDAKNVHILMTLTSPACPVAGILPGEVECAARATPGIGDVSVELTWDPPFTIDRMSDEIRLMLGDRLMKFSAQEEYGLRCLLQIARLKPDQSITIVEISKLEGLTQPHVAKLMMILRKEGFINSTRGQTGGYMLAKTPEEIVVGDVLNALGGKLYDEEFCGKHSGHQSICAHDIDCGVRSLWQVIQTVVDNVVYKITIADLIKPAAPVPNVTIFSEPRRLQPISQ